MSHSIKHRPLNIPNEEWIRLKEQDLRCLMLSNVLGISSCWINYEKSRWVTGWGGGWMAERWLDVGMDGWQVNGWVLDGWGHRWVRDECILSMYVLLHACIVCKHLYACMNVHTVRSSSNRYEALFHGMGAAMFKIYCNQQQKPSILGTGRAGLTASQ